MENYIIYFLSVIVILFVFTWTMSKLNTWISDIVYKTEDKDYDYHEYTKEMSHEQSRYKEDDLNKLSDKELSERAMLEDSKESKDSNENRNKLKELKKIQRKVNTYKYN